MLGFLFCFRGSSHLIFWVYYWYMMPTKLELRLKLRFHLNLPIPNLHVYQYWHFSLKHMLMDISQPEHMLTGFTGYRSIRVYLRKTFPNFSLF